MRYLILGIITIFGCLGTSCNKYFMLEEGYVILETGDTIYGKLRDLGSERSCFKIRFTDKNGKKVRFKEKDVFAYKRGPELYFKKPYKRPTFTNMQGYMKLMEDGKIKLYRLCYVVRISAGIPNQNRYTPSGFDTHDKFISGGGNHRQDYYIEINGELLFVKKKEFNIIMEKYLSDNKELFEKISTNKLGYNDLTEIIRIYNES